MKKLVAFAAVIAQLYHSHLVATNQQKTLKLQKLKQKLQ